MPRVVLDLTWAVHHQRLGGEGQVRSVRERGCCVAYLFGRYETLPPWCLAPTLSPATCLSNLRVVGRGPARDVGLRPLGRGRNTGRGRAREFCDVTEFGRPTPRKPRPKPACARNDATSGVSRSKRRVFGAVSGRSRSPKNRKSAAGAVLFWFANPNLRRQTWSRQTKSGKPARAPAEAG